MLVVDELTKTLEKDQGRLAFIYYDFSDARTQTPLSVVSSLLMQLISQGTSIPSMLENFYYKLKGGRLQLQLHELTSVLVEVCKDDRPTYVVIDVLDECEAGKPSQVILDVMQHLEQASIKLFITSRPHSHSIRQQLGNSPQVTIEASTSDITKYLTETIDKDDAANDVIDETLKSGIILELYRGFARDVPTPCLADPNYRQPDNQIRGATGAPGEAPEAGYSV